MLEWILLSIAVMATMPLRLSVRLDINKEPTFEVVLYVYGLRIQFDGPINEKIRLILRWDEKKGKLKLPLKAIVSFCNHLFQGANFTYVSADCTVGTGDAYTTALVSGGLLAVLRMAGSAARAKVTVRPNFQQRMFVLSVRCILSLRGGDIIHAGIRAFMDRLPTMMKAGTAHGEETH